MFKKLAVFSLFWFSFIVLTDAIAAQLPKGIISLNNSSSKPLQLNDLDGELWDINNERGRWVFVHFWASWCGPCRKEMPTIQQMTDELDQNKLAIYLVNTAEDEDTVFEFLASVAPDLVPLMDTDGLVTEQWQPRGLPATFLVDPQGIPRYVVLGGRPWDKPEYYNFIQSLYQ
jgi:thiol-disulfide isomerase/thioredoxin